MRIHRAALVVASAAALAACGSATTSSKAPTASPSTVPPDGVHGPDKRWNTLPHAGTPLIRAAFGRIRRQQQRRQREREC